MDQNKILLISWVNPLLLPPVIALAKALQERGINVEILTTDWGMSENKLPGIRMYYISYSPTQSFIKRQLAKVVFFNTIRKLRTSVEKVLVFDNLSYCFSRLFFKSRDVFYNILELFNPSNKFYYKTPLTAIYDNITISLLRNTAFENFSLPSVERRDWFCKEYKLNANNFSVILNAPFIDSDNIKFIKSKKHSQKAPLIIHTGGVNATRSVLELVKGFCLMEEEAVMVLTNISNSEYCNDLKNYVANSSERERIHLKQFLSIEELEDLRRSADIGVCLMNSNGIDSELIAPNKVGEYLGYGLHILVTDNPYYHTTTLNTNDFVHAVKQNDPELISLCLDEIVRLIKTEEKSLQQYLRTLDQYSMNSQASRVYKFLGL